MLSRYGLDPMSLSASTTTATAVVIGVVVGAAAALAGCTSTPAAAVTISGPSAAGSAASSPGFRAACEFDYRPGSLHSRGGTQLMINGEVYVGCGGGPTIHLQDVDGDTVTFARKSDQVRVAVGGTEQVGPYRVHVVNVRGERVEFEMSRPNS